MLKRKFDKKDEIPKGFEALYEEKDGDFYLIQIEGLKSIEEYNTLSNSLSEARKKLNEMNEKYKHFAELDPADVLKKLDEYEELSKLKGTKKLDNEELNKIAEVRSAQLKRELKEAQDKLKIFETENSSLKKEKINSVLKETVNSLVYDKDKKDLKVYAGVLKDIQIRAERDLEWNEAFGKFVTKDEDKLDPKGWYSKQIAEGAMWEKGSRGEPDGNGKGGSGANEGTGTIKENIREIWGNQ